MIPAQAVPRLRIEPRSGWRPVDLAELWRYRELLWLLALRDIQVRYKQTILGVGWAILQPVLTMLVFTVFFGHLGGMNKRIDADTHYSVYTFCALLPWQLFAFALSTSSSSVVGNRALLTKVYFPRVLIPMVPLPCALLDFTISFVVLMGLMAWFHVVPTIAILALPLFLVLALATALAFGLWLSALNAMYRDIQYTVPFLTQLWLLATPVAYPTSVVPEKWLWLYSLNPMVGVVDGFRWALLGGTPPGPSVALSAVATAVLLIGGLFYFRRMERVFADIV